MKYMPSRLILSTKILYLDLNRQNLYKMFAVSLECSIVLPINVSKKYGYMLINTPSNAYWFSKQDWTDACKDILDLKLYCPKG